MVKRRVMLTWDVFTLCEKRLRFPAQKRKEMLSLLSGKLRHPMDFVMGRTMVMLLAKTASRWQEQSPRKRGGMWDTSCHKKL